MEDYLKEALEIVKAQASVRTMNEEEMTSMVRKLSAGIQAIAENALPAQEESPACDPKKSIKEKTIVCCECGKII